MNNHFLGHGIAVIFCPYGILDVKEERKGGEGIGERYLKVSCWPIIGETNL
jgi:hypothetical protein